MIDSAYVAALEKQNRILRKLTAVCCLLLVVVVAGGATVFRDSVIAYDEFILRDRNGTTRFEMVINNVHGRSNGFHVVDANGQTRIDIGVTDRGEPIIAFLDGRGRVVRTLP